MIPVLKSERVILRGAAWADFALIADMWQEDAVVEHLPFAPLSRSQSWVRFNLNTSSWANNGFGGFFVTDREGVFLGTLLFFRANRGFGAEFDEAIEVGWVLTGQAHGKGYASEAVALGLEWMDAQPFGGRYVCMMDADFTGSIRVAQKNGFSVLRCDRDQWGRVQLMQREVK